MPAYYMLLDAGRFEEVGAALAASWRLRSFAPARVLYAALAEDLRVFNERYHVDPEESVLKRVHDGLPFDRNIWRLLVGEVLLYGASTIPEIQTAPDVLCCLLAPDRYAEDSVSRERFAAIQQAHFGSRDLSFGSAIYRPDAAGFNDVSDVRRLSAYLSSLQPSEWAAADLARLRGVDGDEDRQDELDFAREWLPALQQLYQQASVQSQVVVYESL
jgi:hypothetical protein